MSPAPSEVLSADDVFYLTADELFAPPAVARATVVRRRAERERLAGLRMPIAFVAPWVTAHLLEPGEVMVTQVTDVGYTPLFGHAAAVVTDIGGTMSHAAVVAREFGIPAVTDTADGTARLTDGRGQRQLRHRHRSHRPLTGEARWFARSWMGRTRQRLERCFRSAQEGVSMRDCRWRRVFAASLLALSMAGLSACEGDDEEEEEEDSMALVVTMPVGGLSPR